ncbi:MAG TPA: DUF4349 domain-containing protein [Pyrinomonadaceae bacterium]
MRLKTALSSVLILLALAGCSRSEGGANSASRPAAPDSGALTTSGGKAERSSAGATAEAEIRDVSLSQADASQAASVPTERKIIRNAALTIESDAPAEGQRRIASIAEQRGGFVVTSESRHQDGDGERGYEVVTMEVRIPFAQFDAVLGEIRGVGSAVVDEKITGQDVTEEYIDLEARARTQRAFEAQLLELLKRAGGVTEALEVQRALATVRTEIERLEGRRRFLENQSSLSTIKVTLRPAGVLAGASTRGFFPGLKRAFANGIDVALSITLGLIQVIIALIPVFLLIVLPLMLLFRFSMRRRRRNAPPPPTAAAPPVG